jgi:hypothetical protein
MVVVGLDGFKNKGFSSAELERSRKNESAWEVEV